MNCLTNMLTSVEDAEFYDYCRRERLDSLGLFDRDKITLKSGEEAWLDLDYKEKKVTLRGFDGHNSTTIFEATNEGQLNTLMGLLDTESLDDDICIVLGYFPEDVKW